MDRISIVTAGRWSGGGHVVLRNLQFAAELFPDVFTDGDEAGVPLYVRNLLPPRVLARGRFLYLPQNAAPWVSWKGTPRELSEKSALRLGGEVALRRAIGVVRIASVIPTRTRPATRIIPNVLDTQFEEAIVGSDDLPRPVRGAIATIGSFRSYRNVFRLLDGFDEYRRRGGSLRLEIFGSIDIPPLYKRLRDRAASSEGVVLTGGSFSRPQALRLFRDAHAVVFPSLAEASPVTVLEAQALTARIALSNIPGHRETSIDVPPSCFFDPASTTDITRVLISLEEMAPMTTPASIVTRRDRDQRRVEWAQQISEAFRHLVN